MNVTVPTPEFCETISSEQRRIQARCDEIDGTARALEDERVALEERNEALEVVKSLYRSSQQTVDDALATQARLNSPHPQQQQPALVEVEG